MAWILCLSGAALIKAGANRNIALSGSWLDDFSNEAEAQINAITRRDWVALSGATTANFKQMLADTASDLIAIKIINYDMSGYTSLNEASTMCDILRDNAVRNLETLKNIENQEKMI